MKVKQQVTRYETSYVDVEFPVYAQHDVGDEHTYIITYRYELQSRHVPTFLVSKITETSRGFEFEQGQALTVDTDLAANLASAETWDAAVDAFTKWANDCVRKMRAVQPT